MNRKVTFVAVLGLVALLGSTLSAQAQGHGRNLGIHFGYGAIHPLAGYHYPYYGYYPYPYAGYGYLPYYAPPVAAYSYHYGYSRAPIYRSQGRTYGYYSAPRRYRRH